MVMPDLLHRPSPVSFLAARPQPPSRPVVPQKEVQARQVLLSWEPGSDGLSPVRYYTVQLRELPESNWSVHSASVSHEATSYIVSRLLLTQESRWRLGPSAGVPHPPSASSDRLKPFTSYQFRVKATNDIGDSEYSAESEAITTLQDGERRKLSSIPAGSRRSTSGCCWCMNQLCFESFQRKRFSPPGCYFFTRQWSFLSFGRCVFVHRECSCAWLHLATE